MSSPPNKRINLTNHGLDGSLAAEARPAVVCRLRAGRWADGVWWGGVEPPPTALTWASRRSQGVWV